MGLTEAQFDELNRNLKHYGGDSGVVEQKRRVVRPVKPKCVEGPVSVTLTLWGHCPSKKNGWGTSEGGKVFIPAEMKEQISVLTLQALFQWKYPGPVEHPEITIKFYVAAKRQDRDGMFTTVLDCMQAAGVLLNDNIARNNGRTVLEPCEFVADPDQRVVIEIKTSAESKSGSVLGCKITDPEQQGSSSSEVKEC